MASYVVMEPPVRDGAEKAVLVRDGFHVLALLLPVVWLLFQRLWIEALLVLVAGAAIGALGSHLGYSSITGVASLALGVLVGLEGPAMRIAALRRRGWREWGVVEADSFGDAETRYLAEIPAGDDDVLAVAISGPAPAAKAGRTPSGPALGMLGYPGRT